MRLLLAIAVIAFAGCSSSDADTIACDECETGPFAQEREYCVEVLNDFRADASLPALRRAAELEECATAAAHADADSGQPHGHFTTTRGCNGTAFAENEVPGWPLERYDSVNEVILQGAQQMYDEGPGGGHYENITGDYTEVGCGVLVTDADEVWVVHNFR